MHNDQVTVTQAMLKSTHIISMTEAAYWSAIRAAEQRGMERERERCVAVAMAEKYAQPIVDATYREGSTTLETYNEACDDVAQAIRQAAKEQAI